MHLMIIKDGRDLVGEKNLVSHTAICLIAHPDFAANYGLRYYLLAQKNFQKALPCCQIELGIACHDSPQFALEAIANQVDRLYFIKNSPYWPKINSMCQQADILLIDQEELSCLL